MPDFAIEIRFHCQSVESYETEVKGSTDKTYRVWIGWANWPGAAQYEWQCECQSFKFRRKCKHIDAAKASSDYCGWQEQIRGGEIVRDDTGVARCPECNDLAIAMRHAV